MCYRISQIVLILLAFFSGLAIFLPWQRLLLLSDEQATEWLAVKLILLPIPMLCILGATWCAARHRARRA